MTVIQPAHWHIATGLQGYGPDGSDGYDTADTFEGLTSAIHEEVNRHANAEFEAADAIADGGEYEDAWNTLRRSRELDTIARNFNPSRAHAPIYRDNPAEWHACILRMVGDVFPLDVSHNTRLYVWQCENGPECEHLTEED